MFLNDEVSGIVTPEVAEKILDLQTRCIVCGSTYALHIHHRIFRSEGEKGLWEFLQRAFKVYEESYKRTLERWFLHSIQNLVVLCKECHEGERGRGVHGGNEELRKQLKCSFTCSITGFNIPFLKHQKHE